MASPECLYDAEQIAARVRELAAAIRERHRERITLLPILKGAAIFGADLARALGEPLELSFVQAGSYGRDRKSSGAVSLGPLEEGALRGRPVVICDGILDTGRTLRAVVERVREAAPASILTCVLLDKPSRRVVDIAADLVGFTVPDRFVVGYGLDRAGEYRALGWVGALDE